MNDFLIYGILILNVIILIILIYQMIRHKKTEKYIKPIPRGLLDPNYIEFAPPQSQNLYLDDNEMR